ncbi:hypothetical protein [Massilia eburnea]|uniref:hypothetical protein n=1 Tax=Massilia eburnea TaxID=1776165 RepID=UPI003D6A038A
MNFFAKLSAITIISLSSLPAVAGSRSGPHVIWVNLSQNEYLEAIIDKRMAEQDDCLSPSASFTRLPSWISVDLIRKGILKNDKGAIAKLDTLMRKRYDDYIYDGFDGIMVYDEISGPRLTNLVRGRKYTIDTKLPAQGSESAQWEEFCKLMPRIKRPI